ncbi:MAG: MFS transporter [Verrucomicrobia bacterium]|jgi:UMF1 family MFS transporter|nr:MFS transporter [Verrucomicrobiota bacterium]
MRKPWLKRALPWALYDWANSAFATTVMAGFVPLFNKQFWSAGAPETVSTFRLSLANSTAGIVVAILAPVLGAIADRGGARKRFLLGFSTLGVVMTAGLHLASQGQWAFALALYALASIGFSGSLVFYDSLLISVSEPDRFDLVSALGYGLGYVGGGLLFALNVFMVTHPETFGLTDAAEAVRWSFLTVAAWWAVFTVPLLLWVPEARGESRRSSLWATVRSGFVQLRETFHHIRQLKPVFTFLLGYWLYIDGVDTVIRMAVDYGSALNLPGNSLISALLITQFVGFPAAIVFGKLGERLGARTGILLGLAVYVGVCVFGYFMTSVAHFYTLAITVGLVQGGVQSLSRSLYARLIPQDKAGEFFGFYNMLGKFAVIIGPILMSGVGLATGNPRTGILSLILLFGLGALLLWRVKLPEPR